MAYAASDLALYHFTSCPYCRIVRDSITELKLNIELRDVRKDTHYHQELISKGGKAMVPCLRIKEESGYRWLYESKDIIAFLKQQVK